MIQPECQESLSWEIQPVTADVARRDVDVFEGRSETYAAWVMDRVRDSYGWELRHGVPADATGDRRSMGLKKWRKWVFWGVRVACWKGCQGIALKRFSI